MRRRDAFDRNNTEKAGIRLLFLWYTRGDSNPRPLVPKTSASYYGAATPVDKMNLNALGAAKAAPIFYASKKITERLDFTQKYGKLSLSIILQRSKYEKTNGYFWI